MPRSTGLRSRIAGLPWSALQQELDERGLAHSPALLTPQECRALIALDADPGNFRSRIEMEKHGYGKGSYGYFAEPLPATVALLRRELYERLQPMANRMMQQLGRPLRYPDSLDDYRALCASAGQTRPTPLLLRYGPGDFNRLHRDLYGELLFPLQVAVALSEPGSDYQGGEMLFVEQRARQQARGEALLPERGSLVIFPVFERPAPGKHGLVKMTMRHGVSPVRGGQRYVLGVIFHDAA